MLQHKFIPKKIWGGVINSKIAMRGNFVLNDGALALVEGIVTFDHFIPRGMPGFGGWGTRDTKYGILSLSRGVETLLDLNIPTYPEVWERIIMHVFKQEDLTVTFQSQEAIPDPEHVEGDYNTKYFNDWDIRFERVLS